MVYNELAAKITHLPEFNTVSARDAFNALDTEAISDIVLDGNTFWFEYSDNASLSNNQYDWLVNYLKNKGYKHLYA
jgi:hypothetical protein